MKDMRKPIMWLYIMRTSIQHGYHATVCMLGCKSK